MIYIRLAISLIMLYITALYGAIKFCACVKRENKVTEEAANVA